MDIAGLSNTGLVSLAQSLQGQKAQQQVATSVLKIANDQLKQEGQQVLELIQSAAGGSVGTNINVKA